VHRVPSLGNSPMLGFGDARRGAQNLPWSPLVRK
jgi:hypothetical protein